MKNRYNQLIELIAKNLVNLWIAISTTVKAWPEFFQILCKSTVYYIAFIVFCGYGAAWVIYNAPLDTNAFVLVFSTLIGVFGMFPVLVAKFALMAPSTIDEKQVLREMPGLIF